MGTHPVLVIRRQRSRRELARVHRPSSTARTRGPHRIGLGRPSRKSPHLYLKDGHAQPIGGWVWRAPWHSEPFLYMNPANRAAPLRGRLPCEGVTTSWLLGRPLAELPDRLKPAVEGRQVFISLRCWRLSRRPTGCSRRNKTQTPPFCIRWLHASVTGRMTPYLDNPRPLWIAEMERLVGHLLFSMNLQFRVHARVVYRPRTGKSARS